MITFKGAQFPKDVILFAVFVYVRYAVSEYSASSCESACKIAPLKRSIGVLF